MTEQTCPTCEQCGGVIDSGAVVYVRMAMPGMRYRYPTLRTRSVSDRLAHRHAALTELHDGRMP